MVRSRVAAGAGHPWLEWGMESPEPGSAVHDARGAMVFTGSAVRRVSGVLVDGVVVELVSRSQVRVRWEGADSAARVMPSDQVIVRK